jgi:hypothetical protein
LAAPSTGQARVFLHIGEPKTGTTFIQQVLWSNRAELAARGVVLPGHHPQDHFRASQDLRGIEKLASDPAGPWTGEWEILASQAKQPGKTAVISHELFSAADPEQAATAVRSLHPAEVHIVLTVRDMATLLPAEWQETVKHRNARSWEDWLSDVIDRESVDADRRQWWFWRVHDSLAILRQWAEHVPPERIHVVTNPPRGSAAGLLWERFASLLGIDPGCADLSRARPNASLGMAETEFLRRLNQALPGPDAVPDWFYMWNVKETVAHRALAGRPSGGRLVLPAERDAWAKEQAETLIGGLRASGYQIAGDLDDLRPPQETQRPGDGGTGPEAIGGFQGHGVRGLAPGETECSPGPAGQPPASPSDQPADAILDAAVQAAAALVVNQYQREYPAARPREGRGRGLAGRIEAAAAASPRLKRIVREFSSRYPAVRRLRVLAWRAMEKTRTRGH